MLNEYELFYDMFILRNDVIAKENFKNRESRETFLLGLLKYMINTNKTLGFFRIASYLNRENIFKLWNDIGNLKYLEEAINIEEIIGNNCYFNWKLYNPLSMIIALLKISGYDYSTLKISKQMKEKINKCLNYNSNNIEDKYELFYNMYIIKDNSVIKYLENLKDKENDEVFLIGLLKYMINTNKTLGFFDITLYLSKEQFNKLWNDIDFEYHMDYLIYAISDIKIVNKELANVIVNLLRKNNIDLSNLSCVNAKIKKDIYKFVDHNNSNIINDKYKLFYSRYKDDNVTLIGYLENFENENRETFLIGLLKYMIENNETFGFFNIASYLDNKQIINLWEEVGSVEYLEKAINDSNFISNDILSILINLLKISDYDLSTFKISAEIKKELYDCLNLAFTSDTNIDDIARIGIAHCLLLVPTKMADLKKTLGLTLIKVYPRHQKILQVYYEFLLDNGEYPKDKCLALDDEYFSLIGISHDKEKTLETKFFR